MRPKILIAFLIALSLFACNKDKFTTRPQLTFESVNATIFPPNSRMEFVLKGTDKEGDIKDTMWVQRRSLICPELRSDSGIAYTLPSELVKKNNLDLEFIIAYNYKSEFPPVIDGCVSKNDTCYFRFWIKDNANNTSDTVESPMIVMLNQ